MRVSALGCIAMSLSLSLSNNYVCVYTHTKYMHMCTHASVYLCTHAIVYTCEYM